jgi:hypothetical protein
VAGIISAAKTKLPYRPKVGDTPVQHSYYQRGFNNKQGLLLDLHFGLLSSPLSTAVCHREKKDSCSFRGTYVGMVFCGNSIGHDLMDGVLAETVVVSVPHVLWVAFFNFTRGGEDCSGYDSIR